MNNQAYSMDLAEYALQEASQSGVGLAEAYLSNNKELSIEVRDGNVETMKLAEERGLGVRVIMDGRTGFAFTSDLSQDAIKSIVGQAVANAAKTAPDQYRSMPNPSAGYPNLELFDPRIHAASVEEKIQLARAMEEEARSFDPRVKVIESSSYQDAEVEVTVANSLGLSASYKGTFCGLYLALVAGEGEDSQTGFAIDYRLKFGGLDARTVGQDAARRAVRMLGAKPGPTQQAAVIMEPYVATGFLGLLGPALTAEAVQKGRSLFAGKVGKKVASNYVNIVDDGSMAGGIASAPFDGEGIASSRTVLIKGGELQGFLHNTYTAAKEGTQSTGNGVRPSYKGTPEVGTTNFFFEAGATSPEELIKDVKNGLLVTEVMGMHTANPISGDFSLGAAGIWIENGQLTRPVRGIALAGNVIELLQHVDGVGSDLTFFGGKGSPTLRVANMSISGQ